MPWMAAAMVGGSVLGSLLSRKGGGGGGGGMGRLAVNTDAYGLSGVPGEDGNYSVALTEKNTGEKLDRLARQARTFQDLDMLRGKVAPGFGAITDARTSAIRNAASSATSNLRDSLARRRIAGSRFGDDALASVEKEFALQESDARARSIIEEIAMTSEILDQEHRYIQDQIQKNLTELGIATNFTGSIMQAQNTQNSVDKMMAAQNAAGKGQFFGQLAGLAGTAVGSYFGGPAGGAAGGAAGSSLAGLFSKDTSNSTAQSIGLQAYTQGPTQ